MSRRITLFHGMSPWSWEIVKHQGFLRPSYVAGDGERLYQVVEDRGSVYFASTLRMAALYAGSDPVTRFPTLAGRGRWKLPGGIANRDGVVVAGEFDPGEVVYTHRPNSHEEYVTNRPVAASRLRVVAFIPEGSNVFEAARRGDPLPPLPAEDRESLEAIDKDADMCWPGPLIADLEAADRGLPMQILHVFRRTRKATADAAPELPPIRTGRRVPPIGSPRQLQPR